MLTLIYPYRNRDLKRLKNSLDSLKKQSVSGFEVFFVDYGSDQEIAKASEKLCRNYEFVIYRYYPTQFQPWNKSRALNSVVKNLETEFCFVADVDMIFHPQFVETAIKLENFQKAVYFQVGFLESEEILKEKEFAAFKDYRKSTFGATGLSLFPVKLLKELRGFDEFYHFWGAEDTDMHVRIENAGYEVEFYKDEVLLLHQWHPSYRSSERIDLTRELQKTGIVKLNHQHLKFAIQFRSTMVNKNSWGEIMSTEEFLELEGISTDFVFDNEKEKIDDFLFGQLPAMKNKILKIRIIKDPFQNSFKFWVKKQMGKKVPEYYTLNEINNEILLHLISHYRNKAYNYKISDDLQSLELAIKL